MISTDRMCIEPGKDSRAALYTQRARNHLGVAEIGLELVREADQNRALYGTYIVLTFGRCATDSIRRLRSCISHFNEDWYRPRTEVWEADPLMDYCYKARNKVQHELHIRGTATVVHAGSVALFGAEAQEDVAVPPPALHFRSAPSTLPDNSALFICSEYMSHIREFVTESASLVESLLAQQGDTPFTAPNECP